MVRECPEGHHPLEEPDLHGEERPLEVRGHVLESLRARLELFVEVVVLDLAELPFPRIDYRLEVRKATVEGEAGMDDASVLLRETHAPEPEDRELVARAVHLAVEHEFLACLPFVLLRQHPL